LTEIEKQAALSRLDINAVKSAESALAPRVDQLEVTLSRLQELSVARPPNALDPPPSARPHHSAEEIAALLGRGDAALKTGDVTSARLFYEYAADAGNGQAALRMGATFDPAFLGSAVLGGVRGDPGEARRWYRRARDLGETEAAQRLRSLEAK
jgi:hypothetical protein